MTQEQAATPLSEINEVKRKHSVLVDYTLNYGVSDSLKEIRNYRDWLRETYEHAKKQDLPMGGTLMTLCIDIDAWWALKEKRVTGTLDWKLWSDK